MHGLFNRAVQCFLGRTYGEALWASVAADAGIDPEGFETLLIYDDAISTRMIAAAARRLDRPADAILEDVGSYLVSHEPVRRLLRFGGSDYAEFLQSLDELPDRARLAVPDLDLPALQLRSTGGWRFMLDCGEGATMLTPVVAGILRAMADDYGVLAMIAVDATDSRCRVGIELLDMRHAKGRAFALARPEAN